MDQDLGHKSLSTFWDKRIAIFHGTILFRGVTGYITDVYIINIIDCDNINLEMNYRHGLRYMLVPFRIDSQFAISPL